MLDLVRTVDVPLMAEVLRGLGLWTLYGSGGRGQWLPEFAAYLDDPVVVAASLDIGLLVVTLSGLSFLGLGFPPDFPTWGRLLYDAIEQMQMYPWRVILPGIFISLTVQTVNYIGDGLRDAMDPRIRGR